MSVETISQKNEFKGKMKKDKLRRIQTNNRQRCKTKLRSVGAIEENYRLISTTDAVLERRNSIWTGKKCLMNIMLRKFGKNNLSRGVE